MNHTAEYLGKMATAVQSYKEKYNITFTGETTLRGSYIMEFVYHLIIPRLTLAHPKWRADVLPSGSSVESLSDEDFDYMLCVRSLRMSPSDNRYRCLEAPHTTATGFVCYRLDEQLDTDLINLWKDCCVEFQGDLYLSSQKVKKEFLNELFNMASDLDNVGYLKNIEDNGAAVTLHFAGLRGENPTDTRNAFTIDLVLATPADGWPTDIVLERDLSHLDTERNCFHRKLYTIYTQENTKQNCFHLIPKCSDPSSENMVSSQLEWRLSFSRAEGALKNINDADYFNDMGISKTSFKHLTNSADTAAVLMKLLVKNFLCPPKILTSYHLKTIFFNINESLDPMFWVSDLSQSIFLGTPSRYL